jgi:uncharacterized membrane protein
VARAGRVARADALSSYLLLLLAVGLLTAGQIFQKLAVDRSTSGGAWSSGQYLRIIRRPELYIALACLGVGTAVWLVVLYEFDVSKAFPFISLGQILIIVSARVFFGESISLTRWIGVILIAAGIGMIAPS